MKTKSMSIERNSILNSDNPISYILETWFKFSDKQQEIYNNYSKKNSKNNGFPTGIKERQNKYEYIVG